MRKVCVVLALLLLAAASQGAGPATGQGAGPAPGQRAGGAAPAPPVAFRLDSLTGLELLRLRGEVVVFGGRRAVHLADQRDGMGSVGPGIAIVAGAELGDGTITADVAASPRPGAPPDARGFAGIAFRVRPHGSRFECFYLRMTNGRANDQVRRNHSLQYVSHPDFSWEKLRRQSPGVYESYADLEPGVWTPMRIEVAGKAARLYLHGAEQPVLVVNDLKLGDGRGGVGLYVADDTDAYFSNLTVRAAPPPPAGR